MQKLLKDLFTAYYDARKNKRDNPDVLAFEIDYEKNLFRLCREMENRTYKINISICFIVDQPVKREIFAGNFRDRVVHHLIFNQINPIFEKHFIKDSYSCRTGKGTSYGIKRVNYFIRSCSLNYAKDCYILKLDISGYFMSMDRNILYKKIESKLGNLKNAEFDVDLILHLIRLVIFHDPTKNCRIKGKKEDWVGLPKSKSLFFAEKNKGFPIGNLTSQLFGNIYLDDFDHFVREKLGCKYYGRYVDDIVIVHRDGEYLKLLIPVIKKFLDEKLDLKLHPKKIYLQHFSKGARFLGVFIKPWRVYAGKRIKGNFYAKIKEWNEIMGGKTDLGKKEIERLVAGVNSYLGLMSHYQTLKLRKKMIDRWGGGGYLRWGGVIGL